MTLAEEALVTHGKINQNLDIAQTIAASSKDPSTKVGAVITDSNNRIIGTGYNGFVAGCEESLMTWERPLKYALVVHAEVNAVLFASQRDLSGCVMYSTQAPCENCLKTALQSGIREFYYRDDSIMCQRGTPEQKEAITRLAIATNAIIENEKNEDYIERLFK